MNCKLFVANLPLHYGQPELVGLFMQFGRIIESRILMDANTGLSRCKAFVQFDNRTEATNAAEFRQSMEFLGSLRARSTRTPLLCPTRTPLPLW